MTTVNPLRDTIIFQFIDETSGLQRSFTEKTASGIIIQQAASLQKVARWGEVVAVGPDSGVNPGEFVLIEGLQWTPRTEIDGDPYWKTDDSRILAVVDKIEDCARQ